MIRALSAAAVLLCVAYVPNHARAAEITLLSPGAVGSSLRELVPQFEQASGHKVKVGYSPALALVDKLKQGEVADAAIVGSSAADELMTTGKLIAGSKVVIARVGVGVFVRHGDPKPDISSRDAFLRSVINAKLVSYSDPKLGGTAANYVGRLMDSLDVTGSIGPKTKLTPPAKPLADFVASGGADFGLTQITEILQDPRLELVGPSAIVIVPILPWRPISGFCSAPAISERHSRDSGFSMQGRFQGFFLEHCCSLGWI